MKLRYITLVVALFVAGCSNRPALILPTIKPYRMDVQQGNFITQEMINKVRPGMTTSQVRFALGTPLIVDPFHPDRWDYVYLYQKAGVVTEQRRVVAIFKDERLLRIEGDVVPAGSMDIPGDAKGKPATPSASGTGAPAGTGSAGSIPPDGARP